MGRSRENTAPDGRSGDRRAPRSTGSQVAVASSVVAVAISATVLFLRARPAATSPLSCGGEYADTLQVLAPRVRDIEQGPRSQFTYLIRSLGIYECPLFGTDGKLLRRRVTSIEHGTGFAYESNANETYLLTNEHVVSWPEVTSAEQKVDGVPEGCKRVEERHRIVRDDKDDDDAGQIPLTRVAMDVRLDAAILKANQRLNVLPYRLGRSASLRQGNAVQVRGFPLGLMAAVNTGKVVNPYDRDDEQGWDHVDFVIDAILSEGNSGSPVLALSCAKQTFELVGLFHAGYKGHGALNVVVGIDELREFMEKKKRLPRGGAADPATAALAAATRERVRELLASSSTPLVDLGPLLVRVEAAAGGTLLFHVYGRNFPFDDRRAAVIEDSGADGAPDSAAARLWFGGGGGFRAWTRAGLGADERDLVDRLTRTLRLHALRTLEHRKALAGPLSPDGRRRLHDIEREEKRSAAAYRELASALTDLVERLGPARDGPFASASPEGAAPRTPEPQPPAPAPMPAPGGVATP